MKQNYIITLFPKRSGHDPVMLPNIQHHHFRMNAQGQEVCYITHMDGEVEQFNTVHYKCIQVIY